MRYVSTRGGCAPLRFTDAVLAGLAPDGGLLVPERFVNIADELDAWRALSFTEVAQRVFRLYVDDIPGEVLDGIVADAFAAFDHPQVVPLVDFGEYQMLELFHGPTLSFKDVALQVLGRLFEHILRVRQGRLNIMGATSGDTGSAAIHGVRGRADINIFVLFPKGRVSALQERQMTTVPDANVHCLAIEGSFDDCQAILKSTFSDAAFKQEYALGAVNSMNWARVLAQMSYYIHAALHDGTAGDGAVFSVPTGNFGNIFAGIAVRAMGVPIRRFMLATNDNDILARFFQSGVYKRGQVRHTISPSMDIQVASNFERFLHLRFGGDAERVRKFMADFAANGEATVDDGKPIDEGIASAAVGTEETLATMRDVFGKHRCVVDPHTAVSIAAARRLADMGDSAKPICMAAAHPAKFPEAVREALGDGEHARHPTLDALKDAPTRRTVLPASREAVMDYVRQHA